MKRKKVFIDRNLLVAEFFIRLSGLGDACWPLRLGDVWWEDFEENLPDNAAEMDPLEVSGEPALF